MRDQTAWGWRVFCGWTQDCWLLFRASIKWCIRLSWLWSINHGNHVRIFISEFPFRVFCSFTSWKVFFCINFTIFCVPVKHIPIIKFPEYTLQNFSMFLCVSFLLFSLSVFMHFYSHQRSHCQNFLGTPSRYNFVDY